ncbi:hypothetical protein [Tateyamaria pelophila]|uniref:hypothetical protein n=1 Tax=Tateyamaria pelophila TaxID=328415 RepID=UPI001CBFF73E|nr:hypothetical protein [Tateyamaria pelophila]
MSLTRLVMRLSAARALRDRTLAGARVFDSAVDPIDQTIAETRQPLIVCESRRQNDHRNGLMI